jgi:hypothetical protein
LITTLLDLVALEGELGILLDLEKVRAAQVFIARSLKRPAALLIIMWRTVKCAKECAGSILNCSAKAVLAKSANNAMRVFDLVMFLLKQG